MKRFLLSISLCLIFSGCATNGSLGLSEEDVLRVWPPDAAQSFDGQYRLYVSIQKAELSGICVMARNGETIRGTVVNEFGIKAFDFEDDGKRCKLKNCMSFLDRFFIRRGIGSDMHFLLRADEIRAKRDANSITHGKRIIIVNAEGEAVAECGGTRRYTLKKIAVNDD